MTNVRLKYLLSRNEGGIWGNDPKGECDTPVLRSTEQNADGSWRLTEPAARYLSPSERARYRLQEGDIVVTKSSGSDDHIGKSSLVDREVARLEPAYSNFMQRLRVRKNVSPNFVWYVLNSSRTRFHYIVEATSTSGLGNLTGSIINRLPISRFDFFTQERIADFLDRETGRIDDLIRKKQRLIDSQNARMHAKLQQMVLGGATVSRGLHSDWLQDLASGWRLIPLKYLVTVMGGATPCTDREDYWNGDIPWVSPKDMKADVITEVADHVSEEAIRGSALQMIPAQAVLIVVRGMILARTVPVCRLKVKATINQDMKAMIARPTNIRGDYLQRMLQGFGDVMMSFVEEAAHGTKKLRSDALFNLRFPVPPLDVQRSIVAEYGRSQALAQRMNSATAASINRLREYRAALITAAVTGQIDVDSYGKAEKTSAALDRIKEKEMQA